MPPEVGSYMLMQIQEGLAMRLWAIGTVLIVVMLGAIGCSQLSEDEIAGLVAAEVSR